MIRTNDITNVTEHRQNLREHLNRVKATGRPLYITSDGVPEAVLLSAKAYDELADRADLAETLAMIERSEADFKAGRAQPFREAMRDLAREFGIKLDQ